MRDDRKFNEDYFKNHVYNGLNHAINVSIENTHIAANRRGQHFLLDGPGESKQLVLPQMVPLSARSNPYQAIVGPLAGIVTYYTDNGDNIDVVHNFMAYDAIIVSSLYATKAIEYLHETAFGSKEIYYHMYMDRLLTPIPLYDKDPQEFDAQKVGCAGFSRVIPVAEPMEYRLAIEAGLTPSLRSIADCLNMPLPNGKYNNTVNSLGAEYLQNYMNGIAQKEQKISVQKKS